VWCDSEWSVVMRTDYLDGSERGVELVLEDESHAEVSLGLVPTGEQFIASRWHNLDGWLNTERVMNDHLDFTGETFRFDRATTKLNVTRGLDEWLEIDQDEARYFRLDRRLIRCTRCLPSNHGWSWSCTGPQDTGELTLVTHWTGQARPF
jgi:hypothetical protein